jgi:hypothetical protein
VERGQPHLQSVFDFMEDKNQHEPSKRLRTSEQFTFSKARFEIEGDGLPGVNIQGPALRARAWMS